MKKPVLKALWVAATLVLAPAVPAGEWSGYVAGEFLGFLKNSNFDEQHETYLSMSAEPEYYHEWDRGDYAFTFKPFVRYDQHDSKRTHGDIRELSWLMVRDNWELKAGISKVFWGVTESIHLVDIINQTDQVENTDGEDKLGQPMVRFSTWRDWGTVDFFVMPGYRERTFPGKEGRPRFSVPIDTDGTDIMPLRDSTNLDYAVRWSHYFGPIDIGIAHFSGVTREPLFEVKFVPDPMDPLRPIPVELKPVYDHIEQTSLDLQATVGSWLWKLEAIRRTGQADQTGFWAAAGGFEYTFVGVRETQMDVGVITEYLWDERSDTVDEEFFAAPFQNDLVLGTRLTFNDVDSSEILASMMFDTEGGGQSYNIEASRRFGDQWKLSLEVRGNIDVPDDNVLYSFRADDRVRLELAHHF